MNKASAFGVLVALVACAGVGFSVVEMRKMSGTLSALALFCLDMNWIKQADLNLQ